jgi:molybdate transport system regulatory protein
MANTGDGRLGASGDPYLEVGGVTIDERDVEALRGIDEHDSMHRAAAELGRSYARIHGRISDLEEAVGPLVVSERGGAGGGGSTLTDNARDLVARFERLRAELSELARVEESVFDGRVVDRQDRLGIVETPAGRVRALVPQASGPVQVSVRSDAVSLMAPEDAPAPGGTSVRNRFDGTVLALDRAGDLARVAVDVGAETPLRVLVTGTSVDRLDLTTGDAVVASFKATATRAVPAPEDDRGTDGREG